MTDLVDRLRASVKACRALDRSELLEEAAGEIARLHGEVVLWRAAATLTPAERQTLCDAVMMLAGTDVAKRLAWLHDRLTSRA